MQSEDVSEMDGMGLQTVEVRPVKCVSAVERQKSRQKGDRYNTRNGKPVPERMFQFISCKCRFDCGQLDEPSRQKLFDDFWALESWNSQTVFLRSCMKYVSIKLIYNLFINMFAK